MILPALDLEDHTPDGRAIIFDIEILTKNGQCGRKETQLKESKYSETNSHQYVCQDSCLAFNILTHNKRIYRDDCKGYGGGNGCF